MSDRFRIENTVDGPIIVDTVENESVFEGDLTKVVEALNKLNEDLGRTSMSYLKCYKQLGEAREAEIDIAVRVVKYTEVSEHMKIDPSYEPIERDDEILELTRKLIISEEETLKECAEIAEAERVG